MFLSFPDIVEDPFGIAPEYYANVRPLSESETCDYISHRLRLAGNRAQPIFEADALALVYRVSKGDPRMIDEVCSVAMKCAFADNESVVSKASVSMAADRIDKSESNVSDVSGVSAGDSIHNDAPANQNWVEASREFGVQNQIIDRLREEAATRNRELEGLYSQVAELTREKLEWQHDSDEQEKLHTAISSMEEEIKKLRSLFDGVSSENVRLADEIKAITEGDNSPVRCDLPETDSMDGRQDPAQRHSNSRAESRPRLSVVPAEDESFQDEVVLSDERVLVSMDPRPGEHYRIREGRLGLGSNLDNDFPIKSRYVSPHHARIESDDNHCVLVDLNSTNGTFVNGKRISRRALRNGDEIWIGKCKFQFVRQVVERRPSHSTLAGPGSGDNLSSSRFSAHRYKPLLP